MADYSEFSDQELAAFLSKEEHGAYTEIFHRYKTILYKHAFKMLGDHDEASDVVQELFTMLWEKRAQLHFKTSLSAYLYTVLRNRIFDLISHQKVAVKYVDSIKKFVLSGHYQTDEEVIANELAAIIEREVAALPPRMREIFELSRQEEMSYREIGQALGITEATVKLQVHNATKILKLKINPLLALFPFI